MTKEELRQKMLDYLDRQDPVKTDEWYGSYRDVHSCILQEFAEFLGIKLHK